MSNNWPHQSEVDHFYGNPRGDNGQENQKWIDANIVYVKTPWNLVTSWDQMPMNKGIRVHKKCSDSLSRVFNEIWEASSRSQAKINEWGMNLCGGGFNFRLMKSSYNNLSMHSWGCAVDFDPVRNGFGDSTPNFMNIPQVLKAFEKEGWVWGGKWKKKDGMHWQAAII